MDVDISLDYGLTLLAALLIGTGFVLQQHAAQREPGVPVPVPPAHH